MRRDDYVHRASPAGGDHRDATRPLVLRGVHPAPAGDVPDYVYDPQRQIATDPVGIPLAPNLQKDWTTVEGTHTDGDGGDNETYDWEEVAE